MFMLNNMIMICRYSFKDWMILIISKGKVLTELKKNPLFQVLIMNSEYIS